MPSVIFLIVMALAAWYGYRAFKREAARVSREVRQAEKEAQNRAHGTLEQDPKTGEYRLRKD
ncbi:membrane protein [Brucella endophytica]|uniref:Membrane protein n=1 Tax=Brucella endophytica TaxID=1963359 RepID=A0A916W925_9HYPH|nr:hypothetical protein [Brucella endophytica]GGA77074.1 membrane protein [Brucella endophytica]